jgi:hypothetical protein
VRTTTAPYTASRLAHLVRNNCLGFPVVEHSVFIFCILIKYAPVFNWRNCFDLWFKIDIVVMIVWSIMIIINFVLTL